MQTKQTVSKYDEPINLVLLNIGHAVHDADWNYQNVSSPFTRIYLIREGTATLYLPHGAVVLLPNHLYIVPSFTLHSYGCDAHFELVYIHIYQVDNPDMSILESYRFPTELKASMQDILLVERLLIINQGRELLRYDPLSYDHQEGLISNIVRHEKSPLFARVETSGILLQLFSRFLRDSIPLHFSKDKRLNSVLYYIRKNIKEKLTTALLAEHCFLSEDHFIRLFKEEMLCTPLQYITKKKVERAQLMLITSNSTLKDICFSLSFSNVSYFNRIFKNYTGMTPLEYRSRNIQI